MATKLATLRKVIKQKCKTKLRISDPAVAYTIYLEYMLFIQRLASEATEVRKQERSIKFKPSHIVKAKKKTLSSCRG